MVEALKKAIDSYLVINTDSDKYGILTSNDKNHILYDDAKYVAVAIPCDESRNCDSYIKKLIIDLCTKRGYWPILRNTKLGEFTHIDKMFSKSLSNGNITIYFDNTTPSKWIKEDFGIENYNGEMCQIVITDASNIDDMEKIQANEIDKILLNRNRKFKNK